MAELVTHGEDIEAQISNLELSFKAWVNMQKIKYNTLIGAPEKIINNFHRKQ